MENLLKKLSIGYECFSRTIETLLNTPPISLGQADPPNQAGVYLLIVNDEIVYVGEAKGSSGLRDRLLSKHISGDDSHAIQRAFKLEFPDRSLRRDHIRKTVFAKWIVIQDTDTISVVERLLIWLLRPSWDKSR